MKIKSNDRMPARSHAHVNRLMETITTWRSPHQRAALAFAKRIGPPHLFQLLHAIRRWYSGPWRGSSAPTGPRSGA